MKGYTHTDAIKRSISESLTTHYKDPVNLEKLRAQPHRHNVSQSTRERISFTSQRYWDNISDAEYQKYQQSRKGENNPNFGNTMSDEGRRICSEVNKGNTHCTGIIQKLRTCPHCNKSGGNTMVRWHFDNCKLRST